MAEYTPTTETVRERFADGFPRTGYTQALDDFGRWLAAHDAEVRASVVTEEPERPTSIKPFHGTRPGMPQLFHTYCSEHPDFGTCEEAAQAHRDVADHLVDAHAPVEQGDETGA